MKITHTVEMSEDEDEEYFVLSPCYVPMPPPLEDDFKLPCALIEDIISKRVRHHHPFYRIPTLPSDIIKFMPESAKEGHRILIYRQRIFLQTTSILHDYIIIRCAESITGWIQKQVAYYYTEKAPVMYDEISSNASLVMVEQPTTSRNRMNSMNILTCCSARLLNLTTQQPVLPRSMKRVPKKK